MARVELVADRDGALTPEQQETFDWVVQSRGKMIRPFQVLIHSPGVARRVAELGAKLRFDSGLSDHDRELVILAAAAYHGCAFEWESHLPLARQAAVREELIEHLRGSRRDLTDMEELLVGFVRELCERSTVSAERFERARAYLGEAGVVELCATIGYYTMLGFVMGACDAC